VTSVQSPRTLGLAFASLAVATTVVRLLYAPSALSLSVLAAFAIFATVGALVLSRVPGHRIGQIYLLGALAGAAGALASAVVDANAGLPFVRWLASVLGVVPFIVLVPFPLLLFPTGALPSRRWRPVMRVAVAAVILVAAYPAFTPEPANPLGIRGAAPILHVLNAIGLLALGLVVVAAIVSLVVRFRRAAAVEREQLKWLASAGIWTIVLLFMSGPGTYSGMLPDRVAHAFMTVVPYMFGLAIALIPLATGVAILRYRLWDIDRIVSRTLSYAFITGSLGAAYAGLVVLLQWITGPITAGSDLAIAASTLVVAAAFGPVRRRVQRGVDHRFNRARYDAAWTIDAFTARLRDEVDIDTLRADLVTLIHQTMEPTHVSVWLRDPST